MAPFHAPQPGLAFYIPKILFGSGRLICAFSSFWVSRKSTDGPRPGDMITRPCDIRLAQRVMLLTLMWPTRCCLRPAALLATSGFLIFGAVLLGSVSLSS